MKVFLSWSGEKSRAVAEALRGWLPSVIQEVQPFMSGQDIAAGERWSAEIERELQRTNLAIVCVTRDNQASAWLNFEAGAIAKAVESSRVVPLAIDLKVTDIRQPLGQFQAKDVSRPDILAVVESLNAIAERPLPNLEEAFEKWWPDLEPALTAAAATYEDAAPVREERDLLEEILASVRAFTDQAADREHLEELQARVAMLTHELENAHQVAVAAQYEAARRRERDGLVADLVLRAVSKPPPVLSRAVVLDDYLQPRVRVETGSPLRPEQQDDIKARAARYGFTVEFAIVSPLRK